MNSQMGKNKLENVRLIMYLCIIGKEITDEDLNGDPEQRYSPTTDTVDQCCFRRMAGKSTRWRSWKECIKNPQMEKCVLIELYQHGHMAPFRLGFTTCQSQLDSKLHP